MKKLYRYFKDIMNIFTCELCGYTMNVKIMQQYKCPACQHEMRFDGTTGS